MRVAERADGQFAAGAAAAATAAEAETRTIETQNGTPLGLQGLSNGTVVLASTD